MPERRRRRRRRPGSHPARRIQHRWHPRRSPRQRPRGWLGGYPTDAGGERCGPAGLASPIRLEDELKDGCYEVRAELPGVDPAKDVNVSTRDGMLTITAQRSETSESNGRSEFGYGSFLHSVLLPPEANENDGLRRSAQDEAAPRMATWPSIPTGRATASAAATGRKCCSRSSPTFCWREPRGSPRSLPPR